MKMILLGAFIALFGVFPGLAMNHDPTPVDTVVQVDDAQQTAVVCAYDNDAVPPCDRLEAIALPVDVRSPVLTGTSIPRARAYAYERLKEHERQSGVDVNLIVVFTTGALGEIEG